MATSSIPGRLAPGNTHDVATDTSTYFVAGGLSLVGSGAEFLAADAAGDPNYIGPAQTGSAVGTWIPTMAELRPGDLVFFATTSGYIHHVGMYVGRIHGHPTMINAPDTGSFIQESRIDIGIWGKQFAGGGRFLAP